MGRTPLQDGAKSSDLETASPECERSVAPQPREPSILVLHDGELDDVRALLAELGFACVERRGNPTREDLSTSWDVVVSNPQRVLQLGSTQTRSGMVRITVVDEDSRTLRSVLRRSGVDFTVRRPVHPTALRLLFLHALYRGPEKRRHRRVSIGASVRLRTGWRQLPAVLAELSVTGCRLLADLELRRGKRIRVQLPPQIAGGKGLRVQGRVVRCVSANADAPGKQAIALAFEGVPTPDLRRLRDIVRAHSKGPAVCDELAEPEEKDTRRRRDERRSDSDGAGESSESAPVLMGRDISLSGMRADPHPDVSTGDELKLALHVRAREEPLAVRAKVVRDEGERGLVLEFLGLSAATRTYLEKMVNFLPILAMREDGGEDAGVILSEILENQPG
jgi:hypothetical protein